jgi:hypothetical protein
MDATSDNDIADQQRLDDEQETMEFAQLARRVGKRVGISQFEFSQNIVVSVEKTHILE